MKKLLFMIGIGAMTTTAAPLVEGGLSTSGQEAVEAYNTVEIYMQEMARVLGRIQDKATAESEAPLLKRIVTELKNAMAAIDDPYAMGEKAVTKTDSYALFGCRQRMMVAGMAVHREMLRLARAEFYNSATLIKALQELDMLNEDTSALIR
jgi:hypothetical protein